ncbi:hypothetical protein CRG98_034980, partial [Punica granatum]
MTVDQTAPPAHLIRGKPGPIVERSLATAELRAASTVVGNQNPEHRSSTPSDSSLCSGPGGATVFALSRRSTE